MLRAYKCVIVFEDCSVIFIIDVTVRVGGI